MMLSMPKTISRDVSIANAIQRLGSKRKSMVLCVKIDCGEVMEQSPVKKMKRRPRAAPWQAQSACGDQPNGPLAEGEGDCS